MLKIESGLKKIADLITKQDKNKEVNLDKYTKRKTPLAVKLVSVRPGNPFYDGVGGGGGGNLGSGVSDGATAAKQDDIIEAIGNISELQISTDMDGGGKVAVGVAAVEATFTGTTESIIITADIENTGTLYVGKSDVASAGS